LNAKNRERRPHHVGHGHHLGAALVAAQLVAFAQRRQHRLAHRLSIGAALEQRFDGVDLIRKAEQCLDGGQRRVHLFRASQ
jgi:hypothetical protein